MFHKAFTLLFTILWLPYALSGELVACIDDHPPYQILAEKPYGLHISALDVLAKELSKELAFIQAPNFARCVALLEKGKVDVIAGLTPSKERDKFAFYVPFKIADELRVISRSGINIESYDDFHGKIIGVSRGTDYFSRFDEDDRLKKIAMQSERIGFSLLLKKRIDLMMASPATIQALSKEISEANLNVSSIELEELRNKETAFGFSKAHRLGLTQEEIVTKVSSAYKKGLFN